jgi:hypothetical protein
LTKSCLPKGQTISKANDGVLNCLKEQMKNHCPEHFKRRFSG